MKKIFDKAIETIKKTPKKWLIIIGSGVLIIAVGITVFFTAFYCNHEYILNNRVFANCSRKGKTTYTCSKCGKERIEITDYNKNMHNYEKKITKEATCTEDGIMTFTCINCKKSYEEPIKAEHKWVSATCLEPEKCSVCGETRGEKSNSHTFKDGKCIICGLDENKTIVSSGVTFKVKKEEINLNYYNQSFSMSDINIKYERSTGGWSNFYVYYNGVQMVGSGSVYFNYSLKDEEGYVVASGSSSTPDLKAGEKTRDVSFSIILNHANGSDLRDGGVYTLEISNSY